MAGSGQREPRLSNQEVRQKMHQVTNGSFNARQLFGANYVRSLLPQDFFATSFEKDFRHMQQAVASGPLSSLFTLEKLDQMLAEQAILGEQVGAVVHGFVGPKNSARTNDGMLDLIGVRKQMAGGASIRLQAAQIFDPAIRQMCAALEKVFGCGSTANIYITPPGEHAFKPHYDEHDVMVLQVAGTKTWSIYPDYEHQIELPNIRNEFRLGKHKPLGQEPIELTMNEGDFLYIPRGVMHDAHCTDEYSCHITFALHVTTWADYLGAAVSLLNDADVDFRRAANVRPMADRRDHAQVAKTLADLTARIASLDPDKVERKLFDTNVSKRGTVCGNAISSALKQQVNPELTGTDYTVSLVANATMRLFQDADKTWHLWSAEHSAQLSATEASVMVQLEAGQQLSSDHIRQMLGDDAGDTFVKTLAMLGLITIAGPAQPTQSGLLAQDGDRTGERRPTPVGPGIPSLSPQASSH